MSHPATMPTSSPAKHLHAVFFPTMLSPSIIFAPFDALLYELSHFDFPAHKSAGVGYDSETAFGQ